jgi:CubicO group peptidase (beta-lactamase class C family)
MTLLRTFRAIVLLFLFSACGTDNPVDPAIGDSAPDAPRVNLTIVSGNGQTALQGEALADPLVIEARTESGEPQAGLVLTVTVSAGGGAVESTYTTDSDGRASLLWTLGLDYTNSLEISDGASTITASAVSLFNYFQPPDGNDGWETESLDLAAAAPLFRVFDEVRNGRWSEIHSLLVAQHGKLVFEAYAPGKNSSGQRINWSRFAAHEVQSASKSFRSALIGIAIDQGFISGPDEPLSTFYPDFAAQFTDGKEAITLGHMLTMSSGLEWNEAGAAAGNTNNSLSRMYATPASNWTSFVLTLPLQYNPGSTFVYNTGASLMLADIVVRATGAPLRDFVDEFVADPLEIADLAGGANPLASAYRPRDMLKLGQVFLNGGTWKGRRIVSEAWVRTSLQERFQFSGDVAYGYQWWMRTLRTTSASYRVQYAAGNGGQYYILIPDLDLVVVSTGGNFGSNLAGQIWTMMEQGILTAFE